MATTTNVGFGLPDGVWPTSAYATRAPSPPYIHIPSITLEGKSSVSIIPSSSDIDSSLLTKDDLEIITGGRTQIAFDQATNWQYEDRRTIQPVLDFLYLGPVSAVRDVNLLRSKGITMILFITDPRLALNFTIVQKRASALGIKSESIFTDTKTTLVSKFSTAVKIINDHLLDTYHAQALRIGEGSQTGSTSDFKRGKVLVCCETGNEQSAGICAAYLMAVFGLGHKEAVQFVTLQRFCVNLDEELKNKLRTYDDILSARRDVHRSCSLIAPPSERPAPAPLPSKRHIEDTMDLSGDEPIGEMDEERYISRDFAPYIYIP